MDAQEIRALLGKSIFERAQKYRKRILQSSCTTNEDGVRHLTALVQGSGSDCYYTQVWLRENGSFVSASCDCPYNQNGDGTYCKHIGALLLQDAEKNPPAPDAPAKKPESIPGVQRGVAGLNPEPRKDSYSAGLDMLFGRKWRGEGPGTDYEAQLLLKRYQREDAQPQPQPAAQRTGFALLEPELTPHNGRIWLRLRVSDGIGRRQYLVKSIPQFLDAVEQGESVSYGKSLAFVHRWDAFAPDAQQLLRLLRRQVSARQAFEAEGTVRSGWEKGPAGGLPLTGEGLDALVELYAAEGVVGGYTLKEGLPVISLKVERRKGGVQLSCTPALSGVQGLDYAYLLGETTLWRMQREECRRVLPVLETFGGRSLFFTSADAAAFCSYVLPELGNRVNIVDPDRLLLNQIPLEPVVQFYLDADRGLTVTAYPVFLYGEDRVAPGEPVPPDLLRDARTENRAKRLLETYLEPESGKPGH
uniref:SNF2 helicase associated domain-containing protein n=1 Tax=Faecalibacterium prausnitzii TaxID=853 RepID=UPI004038B932